jgi:IS5 family transposase
VDTTVTTALMHNPSDSSLLWDAVRVLVRLLREADTLIGGTLVWLGPRVNLMVRARFFAACR